jgi:hypothetical protein
MPLRVATTSKSSAVRLTVSEMLLWDDVRDTDEAGVDIPDESVESGARLNCTCELRLALVVGRGLARSARVDSVSKAKKSRSSFLKQISVQSATR